MSEDAPSPPAAAEPPNEGARRPPPYRPPTAPTTPWAPPAPAAPGPVVAPGAVPPHAVPPGAPTWAAPPLGGTSSPPPPGAPPPLPPPSGWGAPQPPPPQSGWGRAPASPPAPGGFGYPGPSPVGFAPPPAPRPRRRALWVALGLLAVAFLAAAGLLVVLSLGGGDGADGPVHPDSWDPLVADLVDFVEQERGQAFDHPVRVNFLDADAYREATGADELDPSDEDAAAAEEQVGLFRALGLMTGPVDLIGSSAALFEGGTAAFYDTRTEEIYVNGEAVDGELPVSLAVTVVHELTHALQDQMVGLDEIGDDPDVTTEWSDAHLAVVEGDAMAIEQAYIAELSSDDADSYFAEWNDLVERSDTAIADSDVPATLDVLFGVPYVFGPSWVITARAAGAQDEVDAAIAGDVPSTVAILDLELGGEPPARLDELEEPEGTELLDHDTLGALSWLVVLGEYNDPDGTFDAAGSWLGDQVVTYLDDRERVCFDAEVLVDPAADGSLTFADAAVAWSAALPVESGAEVAVEGDRVVLHACDPGPEVTVALTGGSQAAVDHAGLYNTIVAMMLQGGGVEVEWAECYAGGLLDQFGAEELNSDEFAGSPEFQDAAEEIATSCLLVSRD